MNAGTVTIRYDAVTDKFVSDVKIAETAVTASSRAIEQASAKAVAAWQRELVAQDRLSQKTEESARAKELAALKADILSRAETTAAEATARATAANEQISSRLMAYSGAAQRATAANLELAASQNAVAAAHGHALPPMAAASASVRALEGNITTNTRAAERFLTTTLGLGPVLETAFPVIGAVALGAAILEMGKKAYDAYENIFHLRDAIKALDAEEIDVSKHVSKAGDAVEQKIEEIISKREGQAAMLQQRFSYQSNKGIDLSEYFYSDNIKKQPTNVKADYETLYKNIAPGDVPQRLKDITAEIQNLQRAVASTDNSFAVVKSVRGFGPGAAQSPKDYYNARLQMAQQIKSELSSSSDERTANLQAIDTDHGAAVKKEAEERQRKAEEASRKAAEAVRKAGEAQWKAMEANDPKIQQGHQKNLAEEANYWESMIAIAAKYPDNLTKVKERAASALEAYYAELDRIAKAAVAQQKSDQEFMARMDKEMEEIDNQFAKAQHREQNALAAGTAIAQQNADAMRELVTSREVATGAITRHDAALQNAAAHEATYTAQLAAIEKERQANNDDTSMGQEAKDAANDALNNRRDQIQGEADRRALQDKWDEFDTTALGGAVSALQDFIATARDVSSQWKNLTAQTIKGLNDNLVKGITGQKTDFRGYGRGLATTLAGDALNKGEAGLLSRIPGVSRLIPGLDKTTAKADTLGTAQNPMYVRVADGGGLGAAGSDDSDGGPADFLDNGLHALKNRSIKNFLDLQHMEAPSPIQTNNDDFGNSLSDLGKTMFGGGDDDSSGDDDGGAMGIFGKLGGLLSGLFKHGTSSTSAKSSGGGIFGALLSGLWSVLPHFAEGGQMSSGGYAWVGERGPEIVHMPGGANVIPNHKIGPASSKQPFGDAMLGGGVNMHKFSVDARGATSPAMVEASARAGVVAAIEHARQHMNKTGGRTPIPAMR